MIVLRCGVSHVSHTGKYSRLLRGTGSSAGAVSERVLADLDCLFAPVCKALLDPRAQFRSGPDAASLAGAGVQLRASKLGADATRPACNAYHLSAVSTDPAGDGSRARGPKDSGAPVCNLVSQLVFRDAQRDIAAFLSPFYTQYSKSSLFESMLAVHRDVAWLDAARNLRSWHNPAVSDADVVGAIENVSSHNALWCAIFKSYLDKRVCAENLRFFLDADDYLLAPGVRFRALKARRLYEQYVAVNSIEQINVPSSYVSEIHNNILRSLHM